MKEAEETIPHLFRCPISLELFKDPVTLSTGQTYERSNIEKWLSTGNLTCPVTMQKLHDLSLVPNNTVQNLIYQWLQMEDQIQSQHFDFTLNYLASMKNKLESDGFSFDYKIQVLQRARVFFEECPNNSCFIQFGFLSLLLDLVFGKFEDKLTQEYQEFVEEALSCIVIILSHLNQLEPLNTLMEDSKLSSFIALFKHGTPTIKIGLCRVIEAISSSVQARELGARLGNAAELLREIVEQLLHSGSEVSDAAAKAILSLCNSESSIENLVAEGAIHGLVRYISKRGLIKAHVAMAAIEKLLVMRAAKEELVNHPDGLNAIIKMVFKVSDLGGSESAVGSLIMICYDSVEAREEAIRGGVLSQLLLLLQSQCCVKTKTKARKLLKLLRSKWLEDRKHL